MTTQRFLSCLTLLLIGSFSVFAEVTPLPPSRTPLARMDISADGHSIRNPFDDYSNIRVNSDNSGQLQNEEQACISPLDSTVFVAVWRDFRLGYRRIGVGYSHDAGATWTDALFPQMYYQWQSDPTLVVDAEGNFTANVITYNGDEWTSNLLQVTSYDGGVSWHDSVWAVHDPQPDGFEDKQMLAVDVSDSPYHGTYYCSWSRFYNYPFTDSIRILLTYKRPGADFSEPIQFSSDDEVQWSNVCVGPDGEVFVSWTGYDYLLDSTTVKITHSLDGGATWATPQEVTGTTFFSSFVVPDLLVFAYGTITCDLSNGPHRGRLYMVFTDAPDDFSETDVWLVYSDDLGETWSDRQAICDEPQTFLIDQFHPWISVDEEGRVWVVFYDRRNDPNGLLMDSYFTVSTNGGDTWRANERISTVSSDPGAGTLDAGLIGEYVGWQARNGQALAVWTDTRNGNQDAYSALIDSVFMPDAADDDFVLRPSSLKLSAFPNPTNGAAMLTYSLTSAAEVQLKLYDVTGRLVREQALGGKSAGEHHVSLDLAGLATGIYFGEVNTAQQSARTKLLLLK